MKVFLANEGTPMNGAILCMNGFLRNDEIRRIQKPAKTLDLEFGRICSADLGIWGMKMS